MRRDVASRSDALWPTLARASRRAGQRGQSLLLVALGGVALLAITGLALDGGFEVGKYRQAQNGADAGALAAARANLRSLGTADGCTVAPQAVTNNNVQFRSCTGLSQTSYRPSAAGFSGNAALATVNAGVSTNISVLGLLNVTVGLNGSIELFGAHGSTSGGSTPSAAGTVDVTNVNESATVLSALLGGPPVGTSVSGGGALYQCSSSATGVGSRSGPYGNCPPGTVSATLTLPLLPPIPVATDLCAQVSQINGTTPLPPSCLPPLPSTVTSQYVSSSVSPSGTPLQVGGNQAVNLGLTGLVGVGVTATGVSVGSSQGQGVCVNSQNVVAPGSCASLSAASVCVDVAGDALSFVGNLTNGGLGFTGTVTGLANGGPVSATLTGTITGTAASGTFSGGMTGSFSGTFSNGQLSGTATGTANGSSFKDVLLATANGSALTGTLSGSANAICINGLQAKVSATAIYDPSRGSPVFDTFDRCSAGTITYISGGSVVASGSLTNSCNTLSLNLANNLIRVSGPSWTVSNSCTAGGASSCSAQFCLLQVSVDPSLLNQYFNVLGIPVTATTAATVCLVSADATLNVAPFTFTDGYSVVAHAPTSTFFLRVIGVLGADPAAAATARYLMVSNVTQPAGGAYAVPWISTAQKGTCGGQRSTLQIGCIYAVAGPGVDKVIPSDQQWDGLVAATQNPIGSTVRIVDGPGPAPSTFLGNHATYYLLPVIRNTDLQVLYYAVFLPAGTSGSDSATTYYGQLVGGAPNDFVSGISPQIVQAQTLPANLGPGYDPNVGEAAVAVKLTKNS